jgi:photosystem II stability/assembly factor-like uncharacterized protein
MKRVIIRCLLATAFWASLAFAQDGWFWQYPKPQGNTLSDIFVFDGNKAIAVGDLGTMIRTTDGGENWDVRHHLNGSSNGLGSLFFINDQTGWVIQGNTLLKTTDGGETWDWFFQDAACAANLVYFLNADTGFVFGRTTDPDYGYGMIMKTTDGGNSWRSQGIGFDIHGFTSACFTSPDTGWVVGSGFDGNEIYKTDNCGGSWVQQSISPRIYGFREIQFINGNTGFLIALGEFLKTTDGGLTWEYQNLWEKYQKYLYSMHFVDSLHGWIVGGDYDGFILRTVDGGVNWEEENMDIPDYLYRISFFDTLHGWIVGRSGLIYRTVDGGENWISQRDGSTNWLTSISFADEQNGWVVGENGCILNTTDGGVNWFERYASNTVMLFSIDAIDRLKAITVGAIMQGNPPVFFKEAVIMMTIDGGYTWKSQTIDTTTRLMSVCFPSQKTGWAAGSESVLKTTDGGESWYPQNNVMNGTWGCVQFIDEQTGWLLSYRSTSILHTTDGGEIWSAWPVHEKSFLLSMYFINEYTGWAVGEYNDGNNLFKTVDGGETWHSQDIGEVCHLNAVYFTDEHNGWVAGYNYLKGRSCIYHTEDGGEHWFSQNSPATESLFSLCFICDKTGWVVGENGTILKTISGGGSAVEEVFDGHSQILQTLRIAQNYPNPFNASTTIRFTLKQSYSLTLKIYDLMGREVETLVNGYRQPGEYCIKWSNENVPSGIYLYRLQCDNYSETKKMIILR